MQPSRQSNAEMRQAAERQAAKREKSLNKVPAMQRVAMELAQALSSPSPIMSDIEKSDVKMTDSSEAEDSDAGVGFASSALPPFKSLSGSARQSLESETGVDIVSLPSSDLNSFQAMKTIS